MRTTALACAALLALTGCLETTGTQDPVGVQLIMSAQAFPINGATGVATAPFLLSNFAAAIIEVPTCNGRVAAVVERREGDTWAVANENACPDGVEIVSVSVQPGSRVSSEALIGTQGHYRLRVPFTPANQPGVEYDVVSGEFDVT